MRSLSVGLGLCVFPLHAEELSLVWNHSPSAEPGCVYFLLTTTNQFAGTAPGRAYDLVPHWTTVIPVTSNSWSVEVTSNVVYTWGLVLRAADGAESEPSNWCTWATGHPPVLLLSAPCLRP